ncbi:hypothetical protein N7507_007055 [Penicillium longicatenatum]|nr:hypothetical protein N7507_007055 [Penicillium longicatenatum]
MEILVHVSAPSRVQDDARYRAQVAAIQAQFALTADTRDSPTQSAVHSVSVGGLARSDHQAAPTIPLPGSALKPQPITTEIGSSQTVALDLVHQPVWDSLDSLVSVIPESLPDLYQASQDTRPCPVPGNPVGPPETISPKKRRLESPYPMDLVLAMPSTAPLAITIAPESPPHPDNTHASPNSNPTLKSTSITPCKSSLHLPPLPLKIRPPPPPISTVPFTSHITPTLSMLTERLNPSRTYKPLYQTRSLDPLERGYWALNINIWPENQIEKKKDLENPPNLNQDPGPGPGLQSKVDGPSETNQNRNWDIAFFNRFWSFLSDFVGKDARAGWGVWCFLEHASSPESPSTAIFPGVTIDGPVPVLLKVYAWGEIAMHMYLVLFLASDRRVRKMGAQWRDSADAVAIQLP